MLIDPTSGSIPFLCSDGWSLVSCLFPLHWVVLSAFSQALSPELSLPLPFNIHLFPSQAIIADRMALLLNGQYSGCCLNQLQFNKSPARAGSAVILSNRRFHLEAVHPCFVKWIYLHNTLLIFLNLTKLNWIILHIPVTSHSPICNSS